MARCKIAPGKTKAPAFPQKGWLVSLFSENKFVTFVSKMKKAELQQAFLEMLFDGPEWQYERFLREHWIENS